MFGLGNPKDKLKQRGNVVHVIKHNFIKIPKLLNAK